MLILCSGITSLNLNLENSVLRPHKAQYRNWHYGSKRSRDLHMCHWKHRAQPIWDRKQTNLNTCLKLFMIFFFFFFVFFFFFFPCIFSYTEDLRMPQTQHIWDRKQTNCNTCLKIFMNFFPPLFFFGGVFSYDEDLGIQNTPKWDKGTGLGFWRESFKSNCLGETCHSNPFWKKKNVNSYSKPFQRFQQQKKLKEKLTSSVKNSPVQNT